MNISCHVIISPNKIDVILKKKTIVMFTDH